MSLCFNIILPFFFFLTLCKSSEHLQDTLLTKLLGQFIELNNTQLCVLIKLRTHFRVNPHSIVV